MPKELPTLFEEANDENTVLGPLKVSKAQDHALLCGDFVFTTKAKKAALVRPPS
jgi:hypothetical protein